MNETAAEAMRNTADLAHRPTKHLQYVDGVYRTPAGSSTLFGRIFPTVSFFAKYTGIILRCVRLAKRGEYGYREWADSSVDVLRALEKCGVDCEITGIEHVRNVDGPCLICANHMSTLETMVLPSVVQAIRDVTFVVKRQLVEYPLFKHIMISRDPIALSQTNPREDLKAVLTGGVERLDRGISIIVFPQGDRATPFSAAAFNTIGVKLAKRAGVPLIPLALRTDAWGLGWPIMEFGWIRPKRPVRFAFGEPMRVEGRGDEEQAAMVQFIGDKLREWNMPM